MSTKQFEPSAQRLRKALSEGKTKKSQLVAGAFLFGIVVFGIGRIPAFNWVRFHLLVECLWSQEFTDSGKCVRAVVLESGNLLLIVFGFLITGAIVVQWFQVGGLWVPQTVAPDFKRISPSAGSARLFSAFKDLPLLVGKVALVGTTAAFLLNLVISRMIVSTDRAAQGQVFSFVNESTFCLMTFSGVFFVCGVIDLFRQRRQFREQVYMDYNEMRREHREHEGDPHLKAHRRALQHALAKSEMIRQIKRSKVIIVERRQSTPRGNGEGA